jgi:hypothetical protein
MLKKTLLKQNPNIPGRRNTKRLSPVEGDKKKQVKKYSPLLTTSQ